MYISICMNIMCTYFRKDRDVAFLHLYASMIK